jgi:cell growth-regulating nucleolar protein
VTCLKRLEAFADLQSVHDFLHHVPRLTRPQSCITEDQKYQGALYKAKPSKADKRKSVSIAEPRKSNALVPRPAYVEDEPDFDIPPAAPSPPPAAPSRPVQPAQPVNVFDFLVAEDTPNTSKVSLGGSHEQMSMKRGAQSIFSDDQNKKEIERIGPRNGDDQALEDSFRERGFSYGAGPIQPLQNSNPNPSLVSLDFMTPAAKATRARLDRPAHSRTNSGNTSDKKRKRGSPEALDLSAIHDKGAGRRREKGDTPMIDAPQSSADTPSLAHSGLTGGLNRLLSNDTRNPFPPTPDYSDEKEYAREMDRKSRHSTREEHPASPLKRSRHSKDGHSTTTRPSDPGSGFSIKGRAGRVMSMIGGVSTGGALSVLNPAGLQNKETAIVKVKRRNSSSEDSHGKKLERTKNKANRPAFGSSAVRQEVHEKNGSGSNTSNTSRRRRGSNDHRSLSPEVRRRKVKSIAFEPHRPNHRHAHDKDDRASDSESDDASHRPATFPRPMGQEKSSELVLFGEEARLKARAEAFLSYVTKGPDSERGYSFNKALKRWHRDGAGVSEDGSVRGSGKGGYGDGLRKEEEQKELWRGLRLRKNERGEVVVFF